MVENYSNGVSRLRRCRIFITCVLFSSACLMRMRTIVLNSVRNYPAPGPAPSPYVERSFKNSVSSQERSSILKNQPIGSVHRIAFITYSYVKHNDTNKLFNFLLPAVDTWAAPTPTPSTADTERDNNTIHDQRDFPLYVVFSHTSRKAFEDICLHKNIPPEQRERCRRIHPIYVDCPEGKFGESPCCKQQKGLVEIFDEKYPLYDWYAFFDDDIYLRKEYVAKLLAEFQPPDFPMAASPYNQEAKPLGDKLKKCGKEGMTEFLYPWGMPIFYSRGAMKMMEKGYRANSLVSQCAAFEVTHDVGNQILNWMYSLPMAALPPLSPLPQMRDDYIGSHWVGREDVRSSGRHRLPVGKSWSFEQTHKKWMNPILKPPRVEQLITFKDETKKWYKNVTGFRQTLTYKLHGYPQAWEEGQWFTMQYSDCMRNKLPQRPGGRQSGSVVMRSTKGWRLRKLE